MFYDQNSGEAKETSPKPSVKYLIPESPESFSYREMAVQNAITAQKLDAALTNLEKSTDGSNKGMGYIPIFGTLTPPKTQPAALQSEVSPAGSRKGSTSKLFSPLQQLFLQQQHDPVRSVNLPLMASGTWSDRTSNMLSTAVTKTSMLFFGSGLVEVPTASYLNSSSHSASFGGLLRMSARTNNNSTPRLAVGSPLMERARRRTTTSLSAVEMQLLKVLHSPIAQGYFVGFCEHEKNDEYVKFYLGCEDYKNMWIPTEPPAGLCGGSTTTHMGSGSGRPAGGGELPVSWRQTDEKVFNTPYDDLALNMTMFVSAIDEMPLMGRKDLGMGKFLGAGPVQYSLYPRAERLSQVYLQSDLLGQWTEIPGGAKATAAAAAAALTAALAATGDLVYPLDPPKPVIPLRRQSTYVRGAAPDPSEIPTPITLSKRVAGNTRLRIENGEFFGPEMFSEASLEVLRYLAQGSYLRFLQSPFHARMKRRGRWVYEYADKSLLPVASGLRVRPPESKIVERLEKERKRGTTRTTRASRASVARTEIKLYEIDDILHDGILYNEFLQRLRATASTECLLCLRSILIFKELMTPPPKACQGGGATGGATGGAAGGAGGAGGTGGSTRTGRGTTRAAERESRSSRGSQSSRSSFSNGLPFSASATIRVNIRSTSRRGDLFDSISLPDIPAVAFWSQQAEDQAWQVCQFFVAKGAAYELSLSGQQQVDILRSLGKIHLGMFWALEVVAKVR